MRHTPDCNVVCGFKEGEVCNCHGEPGLKEADPLLMCANDMLQVMWEAFIPVCPIEDSVRLEAFMTAKERAHRVLSEWAGERMECLDLIIKIDKELP